MKADGVGMYSPFGQIGGPPKDIVEDGGFDDEAIDMVSPTLRQFADNAVGAFSLDDAKEKPGNAKCQTAPSQLWLSLKESEGKQGENADAEDRIDDRHVVPCHANVGKGPVKVSPIRSTGVDKSVRAVTEGGECPSSEEGDPVAKEGPQDGGDEQTPHRDEDERMRELAVELEAEKRIGGGAYEDVEIGSETR